MDASEVQSLLADRPDLEAALVALRDVDREHETWTYDDAPIDSGAFGELVSQDVVESVGDEYRLADPDAVSRALDGDVDAAADADSGVDFDVSLPAIDRTAAGVLAALLVLTAGMRASIYPSVFRDRVVYPGNDPYAYVYFVEEALRSGWSLSELPAGRATQEPLTTVQLIVSVELTGGLGGHGPVLAWWPVVVAVVTALVLYLFVCEVTDDRRIALATVFVLAVLPVHTLRSALGFVDHHAFDYFWLVITAWGLVATFDLETLAPDWRTARAIGLLAVGVAGSVLAWFAAALLLFPIAIAVTIGGALAVRDDESFLEPGLATAVGVGLGAAIVVLAHLAWGWHETVIVGVPVILTVGILGVVGATYAWRWSTLPPWTFPSVGIAGTAGVAAGVYFLAPDAWTRISRETSRLFGDQDIAEFQSLFDATAMGWLFSFGFLLFIIVPAMAWGAYRAYHGERRWLVASSYAWFMLYLSAQLARYAGEFSPFAALFAGVAILVLAERVDAARPAVPMGGAARTLSIPERDVALRLAFVLLLVCGLAAVLAPLAANSIAIPEEQYETAAHIDDHAIDAGHEYPESYVFSPWSWSRMYNYHVSGESRGYGYAMVNYRDFSLADDSDEAYDRYIAGGQADGAYLVTEPIPGNPEISEATMQSRLHDRYGSRGDDIDGLAHYRALYASPSGDYKAFRVVEGATVRGEADAGETVRLSTDVHIEGASFTYERQVAASESGEFAVTVPYPGTYDIDGVEAASVTVDEDAVLAGEEREIG